ncbi:endonuclease/exonuclease/phosphatase family protein [Nocardiopsis sp. CT-R113]|uniref:Endonuclease/exonuclease/phosphatase family protein n=1 Tax=Nocardiopsis codii TaxID=3065942 RepID=A0ABU7KA61_9ACTN|nr:endonuclease/exonuclease/phosphatase family protein [Nocardiopsis sp. CT-R113]MEE2039123.1 endonuclease/exonuclease/phosphatase family protein [Nocardiopsis sp. CT-R113]
MFVEERRGMRQDRLATAVGTVLFLDALRVFLPSLITLFGQAGSTSPALMGAYALAWFLAPLPFVLLARRVPPAATAFAAAGLLAAGRLGLQATDGGDAQLYAASATVGAGTVWLACTAAATAVDGRLRGAEVMVGVVAGVAASAVVHTLVGTVDLAWRPAPVAWGPVAAAVALFVLLLVRVHRTGPAPARPAPPRAWLALGPLLFLGGLYTANPAVGQTLAESPLGAAAVSTGAVLSVAAALYPRALSGRRWAALAALLAALLCLGWAPSSGAGAVLSTAAPVVGQFALAACAGWAVRPVRSEATATRTGLCASGGLLLLVVLVFAFYAAYDLYAPNGYVPFVALAALAAAVASRGGATARPREVPTRRALAATAGIGALTLATTALHPLATAPPPAVHTRGEGLRVAAYNVRMGYGMDGRLAVREQAVALRGLAPDVVVLSEVDRGWMLNGGHDGLSMLAAELGMTAYWGPADGPFWGDAVLTSLPVTRQRAHRLTPSGPTGAQALEVTVDWEGTAVTVVSTHVQPRDYGFGDDGSRQQLRDIARIALDAGERGTPVVVAGDLNVEPDNPAWALLTEHGLADAFDDVRPFPTLPGGTGSDQQIDHVLHTGDLQAGDPANPDVPHSDHRPVAVTLTPVPGAAD